MIKGIIYLKRNGIEVLVPSIPSIIHAEFSKTAVNDLEILNETELQTAITALFATNKIIPPCTFTILLADDICFIKDFPKIPLATLPATPQTPAPAPSHVAQQAAKVAGLIDQNNLSKAQDQQIQAFIDKVPFEDVSSKTISTDEGRKVIVTNKAFFTAVKSVINTMGFAVDSISPAIAFKKYIDISSTLLPDTLKIISLHADILRQADFLVLPAVVHEVVLDPKTGKERIANKNLILLVGVFAILFLAMIILYYVMYIAPKPKIQTAKNTQKPKVSISVTVVPSLVTPVKASSSADLTLTAVQIISNTSSATYAAQLRSNLLRVGFANITVPPTNNISAKNAFIVFSADILPDARELIIQEVRREYSVVTSQENTQKKNAVTVTLGAK